MLHKVISGGQTGTDRAALIAAKTAGVPTGGWMPKGYKAQDGYHPHFATLYGMSEHPHPDYPPRTKQNVLDADATLLLSRDWSSPGEKLTLKLLREAGKPFLKVTLPVPDSFSTDGIREWIVANKIGILNVAGNSENTSPGIEIEAEAILLQLFSSF